MLDGGEARLGLVLVHGFRSSPDMWNELRERVTEDDGLGFVDVLPFGYSTKMWRLSPLSRIPSFTTVADSLKEFLDTEAEAYDRLMVVTHSQGGLALQRYLARMLADGRGHDLRRIRRAVLLACPNNGSEIALTLRRGLLGGNPQERQLRPLNEEIADVQSKVLRDIVHATELTARTCPIPFSVYAGETDGVVPPASARSSFPDAAVLPGNHFTIARPTGPEHRTFRTLRRLMLRAQTEVLPGDPVAAPDGNGAMAEVHVPSQAVAREEPTTMRAPDPGPAPLQAPEPVRAPVSPTQFSDDWFPGIPAVVSAAERISGIDDPAVRRTVIGLMQRELPGFSPASSDRTREHLVEIVTACREYEDPRAALLALGNTLDFLRPNQRPTLVLQDLIRRALTAADAQNAGDAGGTAG